MIDARIRARVTRFVRELKTRPLLDEFLSKIDRRGEAYLFGGAPRDVAFVGKRLVNDLDVFVSGTIAPEALFEFGEVARTRFGGYRLDVDGYEVDIWELHKSMAFRYDASSQVSVANLLRSVCFSTDSIAVSLRTGRVITDSSFNWSIVHRVLTFVVHPEQLDALVATRLARLSMKLKLELSPMAANYFIKCVEHFGEAAIIEAESRWHRGKLINEISIEELKAIIEHSVLKAFRAMDLANGRNSE